MKNKARASALRASPSFSPAWACCHAVLSALWDSEESASLAGAGIRHVYLEGPGGRRRPHKASRNVAWRNKSFRAYADHMETAEFREGVAALLARARQSRTAIMCPEAVWWRCHRALIADYLKSAGVTVYHTMSAGTNKPRPHTSAAGIVDGRLSYEG